jgi:hypothetical protein
MRYGKEARRSLENYRRAPDKGELIITAHPWITGAIGAVAFFAIPYALSMIARAFYGC